MKNTQNNIYILFFYKIEIQSNLSYVTCQGNVEIGSHKTGVIDMKSTVKGN